MSVKLWIEQQVEKLWLWEELVKADNRAKEKTQISKLYDLDLCYSQGKRSPKLTLREQGKQYKKSWAKIIVEPTIFVKII